ncbi:neuropeptide Y precursor,putative [Schistosoma mansoni]|uniref:Neuropeptide Y,putative n=1 Tax=Schistosoma mansoni TaxID=6183 RepID=G4LVY8_SCHMA|nr:neuropeptide Y precursor,putative [Schistosoma mansoni]|eukprot:XP_018645435.1 neuropeptide Y precursor,putative [Schistosoma mansoni]
MYSTHCVQRFNGHSIYYHLFTLLILIHYIDQIHGQYDSYKWRNDQDDTSYIPLNKMTIHSLLNHNDHTNDGRKIIKTRAVEIVPPERPFIFETPEALRTYLHKLNEYFAIIGRPRFGRR